jgi:hypothetical protein
MNEANELVEDIRSENKELLEIIESTKYKLWYNIITRAGRNLIDYFASKNLFPAVSDVSAVSKKSAPGEKTESLKFQNIVLVDQTEKAFKFRNEAFEICWFSKKGVNYNEVTKELEVLGWWLDFVNKKGEPVEFKKEVKK